MATLQAIRQGLADAVDGLGEARASALVVDQVNPPQFVVRRRQTRYDLSFDGADDHTMSLLLLISTAVTRAGQEQLDAYVDPSGANSVAVAVHADATLGGTVSFARVVQADADGLIEYNGVQYLGCDFTVEVGA